MTAVKVRGAWKPVPRLVGLIASTLCVAGAIWCARVYHRDDYAWWLLGAAFVLALLWQSGLVLEEPGLPARVTAPNWRRAILGGVLTLGGAASWAWASYAMFQDWDAHFDQAWLAWLAGTIVASVGLDLLWGHAPARRLQWRSLLLILGLLVVALIYRLWNVATFPGEAHMMRIEELQNGLIGQQWLDGGRGRWEYLGDMWTAAAGIWLLGPTLAAMRTAMGVVSALKVVPVFLWLAYTVGGVGAAVGTALLACTSWDVIISRGGLPSQILHAMVFALLAGPVRRGRPSGYVWLGFVGGYVLYQYIAVRPLVPMLLIVASACSLRDTVSWRWRLTRPLITAALIVSMSLPLFLSRIKGDVENQYLNGWNRAWDTQYYQSNDPWQIAVRKRIDHAVAAAGLFFFHGDLNPAHSVGDHPLIDPVTATLMLVGVGYCVVRLGLPTVTLVMFVVVLAGTLVMTANWDVARAGTGMVYPFVLAGYGAAVVRRMLGRTIAVPLLAAGVVIAFSLNTSFLRDYWSAPSVRAATHSNLALISSWLHQNVRSGERVVVIAPSQYYVLGPNDAMWMRGPIRGTAVMDIESALRELATNPEETLLVLFSGSSVSSVQNYLEWLIPGLRMQFEPDPDKRGGDLAFAHLPARPPSLVARIEAARCLGVQTEYQLLGDPEGKVLAHGTGVAPFIDYTTWSAEIGRLIERFNPNVSGISTRLRAAFMIDTPGKYVFSLEGNAIRTETLIDGNGRLFGAPVDLDAGPHRLEMVGQFRGFESPQIRLLWKGPGTRDQLEVMPLYRMVEVSETCADGQPSDDGVSPRRAWCPYRPLESEAADCQDIALGSPNS